MTQPFEDRRLSPFVRLWAACVTLLIPPGLWLFSFEKLASVLERGRPELPVGSRAFHDADLAAWVDGLLHRMRGPWRHTCLKRAAALFYLLRSAGRPVEMEIGVRRDSAGALQAHAWLNLTGSVYLEPDPAAPNAHEVIARFPETPSGP